MEKLGVQLKDRFLWVDGDSTITTSDLENFLKKGITHNLFVETLTSEIEELNKLLSYKEKVKVKTNVRPLDYSWNIPKEYQKLDVINYVSDMFFKECDRHKFSKTETEVRLQRVSHELTIYKTLNLFSVLRTIIYIINTFEENNVVWGVGRGSSVHSYVLYLIGAHDIDSISFDLKVEEFLRTSK